jgi:hypothetical protein
VQNTAHSLLVAWGLVMRMMMDAYGSQFTVEIVDGPHKRAACRHRARRSMTLPAGCLKTQQFGLLRTCA